MSIPMDKAELLSTLLEANLYGFSLLMFGGAIRQLLPRRPTRQLNRKLLAVACLLLLISTAHLVIDIIRVMQGLILYRDTYPGGPIAFFTNGLQWTFVCKNYLFAVQSFIGDGVILYRCYMVWQSKLVMVVPTLLWCATGVTGILSPYSESRMSPNDTNVFSGSVAKWITSFYATTFATNVFTTSLLASRIWYIDQQTAKLRGHPNSGSQLLRKTLRIVVDTGVIYFLALLTGLISFVLGSNAQFVILDMIVPITSITFYMAIIRVGLVVRKNQPMDPHIVRHMAIGSGICVDPRRMQIYTTWLTKNTMNAGLGPPPSPVAVAGSRNGRAWNEIKPNDTREAV